MGDARAQYNLGAAYWDGNGVLKDRSKSLYWYRKSANQNLPRAQNIMGHFYKDGLVVEKDLNESFKYWSLASDQDYEAAHGSLAGLYIFGMGVEKNMSKAKELIEKAYESNDLSIKKRAKKKWEEFELWKY